MGPAHWLVGMCALGGFLFIGVELRLASSVKAMHIENTETRD
jgi:hypothetical protein